MSRIHEALKKAELERAAQTGQAGSQFEPHAVAPAEDGRVSAATKTDVLFEPRIGTIPSEARPSFDEAQTRAARPHWRTNPDFNVFANPDLNADAAEQFRTLRSRLYQIRSNQPLKTILVTSPVPGDGKTFVTTNLAHAIVRQPNHRVLLIDGDLRASRLHLTLGAPGTPGLSDYLRGDIDEATATQHGQDGNLFLIPGGNAAGNPSELLSNGRLKQLLLRVMPAFDWVIFDSPPCVPVADARLIADLCDGVLLVVRAGATPSQSAQKASQELQGKNVIGVVLNSVDRAAFAYSSYYGSAYDKSSHGK